MQFLSPNSCICNRDLWNDSQVINDGAMREDVKDTGGSSKGKAPLPFPWDSNTSTLYVTSQKLYKFVIPGSEQEGIPEKCYYCNWGSPFVPSPSTTTIFPSNMSLNTTQGADSRPWQWDGEGTVAMPPLTQSHPFNTGHHPDASRKLVVKAFLWTPLQFLWGAE